MNQRQLIIKIAAGISLLFWFWQLINSIYIATNKIEYTAIVAGITLPALFILSASLIKLIGIKKFDRQDHTDRRLAWLIKQKTTQTVDIFLPICGESDLVVLNTWCEVRKLVQEKPDHIKIQVYVLDDKAEQSKCAAAERFGFNYIAREDNKFKKAGNIRNAFNLTNGEFIVIFDADFKPQSNFLHNTLPYFEDSDVAIVQTPQAFEYKKTTGLEQGAGNIQDFFYSIVQPARDTFGAAICVGTNAVYRRSALEAVGGNYQIEHSEDVWTGFSLLKAGYKLKYLPINLAWGDCPDESYAYFKQQTRWAQGSSSLVTSNFFWDAKLTVMQRISFISGFLFYVYCASILLFPLAIIVDPKTGGEVDWIITAYGILALLVTKFYIYKDSNMNTMVAHCLATWSYTWALFNKFILQSNEKWQPTGSKGIKRKSVGYHIVKVAMVLYTVSIIWILGIAIAEKVAMIYIIYLLLNVTVHLVTLNYLYIVEPNKLQLTKKIAYANNNTHY